MEIVKKPDTRVFASGAKTGEILAFPDVLRGWGITLDQTQGKPPIEWMNDAFNRIDLNNLYLLQQGIPEWDSVLRYPINSIIKHDGKIYLCSEENDNNEPNANSEKWSLYVRNASEKDAGILKLATQAEVNAGTNDGNAVTPKKLAEKLKKLPDATISQKGITQLTSTLSDREDLSATPKMVNDLKKSSFGYQKKMTDVTSQRALNTTYTNNTGYPLSLTIRLGVTGTTSMSGSIIINGVPLAIQAARIVESGYAVTMPLSFTIGVGDTIRINDTQVSGFSLVINNWLEFR